MPPSLFFQYPCRLSESKPSGLIAWSRVESVLAVATDDNRVFFFQEEGEALSDCVIEHPCRATTMQWQPKSRILAVGWADGVISLWSLRERIQREDDAVHKAAISLLQWKDDGTRLVTGDRRGVVGVWQADARGRLTPICHYRKNGPVTHCVFASFHGAQDRSRRTSFFFAGRLGVVSYADDVGHCMDVQSLRSPVTSMLYYEQKDRVVIITESLLLTQLEISPSGKVSPVKAKLSAAAGGDLEHFRSFWAGPGLLLTSSSEQLLRFWDLGNEENYVINVAETGRSTGIMRDDAVSAVAFCRERGALVCGTRSGRLMMWSFRSGTRSGNKKQSPSSSRSWHLFFQKQLDGPVLNVVWGHESHLLACLLEVNNQPQNVRKGDKSLHGESTFKGPGVVVLNETMLQASMNAELACMQQSPDEIVIEVAPGSLPPSLSRRERDRRTILLPLRCGVRIRGLAQAGPRFVVWNGTHVELYELRGHSASRTGGRATRDGVGSMPEVVQVSTFASGARSIGMAGEHIFLAEGPRVDVTNLSGVVKQTLSFTDIEGDPTLLDVNPGGTHMAVVTARGMLKIFKVSRREAKQVGSGIALLEAIDSDADTRRTTRGGASVRGRPKIRSIRCNANGTRVSVLVDRSLNAFHTDVDTRIYVYNSDQSSVKSFEFGPDRRPTSHLWDGDEPRLLVVEASALRAPGLEATESVGIRDTEASAKGVEDSDVKEGNVSKTCAEGARARFRSKTGETRALKKLRQAAKVQIMINRAAGVGVDQAIVATLFATSEHGILQQDSFPIERLRLSLMGLRVPYLYFIVASDASKGGAGKNIRESEGRAPNCERRLRSRLMRDFVGLDRVDDRTKRALLDFSYHLTTGNMDEAYRAVKLIQSPSVWENMAHMCVKTKRLDVAEVCLGNMGHARGAKAVREAKSRHPEIEARIAMVAVQLGLLEDAERLYAECGRHDLLNELFQASGQWKEALDIAETQDRIHLRCTHYLYAKHLEAIGDDAGAISHYEAAQAHRHEVPRMLFDRGRVEDLERYVKRSGDPKLFRWWAQYCESSGDLDAAMKYYQRAGDTLSQVRIHCFRRCFDDAAEAAFMAGPQDKAAAYHLARQHEQHGNIKEAINFYTRAGRYNHAVRIAKRAGLDEELAQLASVSPKDAQADAARHFEQSGRFDEAVRLYNRAGQMDRALELCFREKLFESMRQITEQLASDDPDGDGDPRTQANPLVLARCAEFFLDHGEYEKAVLVSIAAGKPDRALELCAEHRVKITDEIADRLAPPKKRRSDGPGWKEHNLQRAKLLAAAARVCKKQQSFHLACKLYTQAGDRMKALASLLKSGDTEKIIFFASVSRSRDVYVLVANWLQNLDWRNDTKIMKAIIQFYTKSRAFSQLAGFYEACAQIEIDEYRDYDRALGAIKDALKYLSKIKGREQKAQSEGKIVELKKRADLMEDFLAAKRSIKTDPEETVRACEELLARPEVDKGIRSGDVYALLIEFYFAADNMESAMDLVDRFMATPSGRKTSWSENPYLKADMLRKILEANGRDWPGARRFDTGPEGGKKHGSDGSSGELSDASVEEEIGEDSELNMNRSIGVDDEGGSFHGTMATYEGK